MHLVLNMAAGRVKESPFSEGDLAKMRTDIMECIGFDPSKDVVASGQVAHLPLLAAILKECGDPDAEFLKDLEEGVNLGVDSPLPRTPGIFEEKVKWKLSEPEGPGESYNSNYLSVEPHLDKVRALFKEEASLGWMVEMPIQEAKAKYGDRLAVAALGVVEEKSKIRVVHDGSNRVHVNHRIKVLDQIRCPGAGELRTILRERMEVGLRSFALLGDVSKAHRRIKVREADWGYQACQLCPETVWLNTVGTYGMGSAAYWWGRFAAATIVRLAHYLAGPSSNVEVLLYVDDLLILASCRDEVLFCGALFYVLTALGIPFRWDKCRGGAKVDWIGYYIDLDTPALGMSEARAGWMATWLETQVRAGSVDLGDLAAVLGRLCFSMGPLEFLRPFISPMFHWSAAVGRKGRMGLPWSMAFLMTFLANEFRGGGRVEPVRPITADLGMAFRADAKAEGQLVRLGGWECIEGTQPARARWFAVELNRQNAPWAFARGEPVRVVASLELLGVLLGLMVLAPEKDFPTDADSTGLITLGCLTDNQGNSFLLDKLMTTSYPLGLVLIELAWQCSRRRIALRAEWVPRLQNEEANDLTN